MLMSRHEGVSFHVMSIYQYKYVTGISRGKLSTNSCILFVFAKFTAFRKKVWIYFSTAL